MVLVNNNVFIGIYLKSRLYLSFEEFLLTTEQELLAFLVAVHGTEVYVFKGPTVLLMRHLQAKFANI